MSDFALDIDLGVVRGGVDDLTGPDTTAAFQGAINTCYANNQHLVLTKGCAFISGTLNNPGVPMIGGPLSPMNTVIRPLPSMPGTADYIKFNPPNNSGVNFMRLSGFRIDPTVGASTYGRHAIYGYFDQTTNSAKFDIEGMYLAKGNDYSIQLENVQAVNAQGVPSYCSIKDNLIFDGVKLLKVGDNFILEDNYIQTTPGFYRHGVWADCVNGTGGQSSLLSIHRNAIQAQGAAVLVDSGRNVQVENNNIESSYGSGSNSSAVIDLGGNNATLSMPIVRGNAIGIFGTSSCQIGIRFGNSVAPIIDKNNIITDVIRQHAILILAQTSYAIRGINKVGPLWVNKTLDQGINSILNPGTFVISNA